MTEDERGASTGPRGFRRLFRRRRTPDPPPEEPQRDHVQRFELAFDLRTVAELADQLELLLRTRLWLQIVAGMVSGVLVGLLLAPDGVALLPEAAT